MRCRAVVELDNVGKAAGDKREDAEDLGDEEAAEEQAREQLHIRRRWREPDASLAR